MTPVRIVDLGRMPYAPAFAEQRRVHAAVLAGAQGPTVLLVEHDPVITVSRRKAAPRHVLASPAELARLGIDVQPTDRGGDVTYHGPGQLVAYPIVRLLDLGLNVGCYIRLLERVVIETVAAFGVPACTDPANTGVWVGQGFWVSGSTPDVGAGSACAPNTERGTSNAKPAPPRKLCAIGVRVSRGVALHGLAINVSTNLDHFQTIVPCGLRDRGVTSLCEILGDRAPTMEQVKQQLAAVLRQRLSATSDGDTAER